MKNIDVLHDSVWKLTVKISLPIVFVSLIGVLSTAWMNDVYRAYCPEVFAVLGLLNICFNVFRVIAQGVVVGAWTETAASYAENKEDANGKILNALYAGFFVQAFAIVLFAALSGVIFRALNVPRELLPQARKYYFIYLFCTALYMLGQMSAQFTTGLGTSLQLFIVNVLNNLAPLVIAWLFLGVIKLDIGGAAACEGVGRIVVTVVAIIFLRKGKWIKKIKRKEARPDIYLILRILKRAIFLIAQELFCCAGYFLVSYQTNRYLSLDYIAVLSVTLPLTAVLNAFSTLCTVTIPQNYALGTEKRTKAIFKMIVLSCFLYGILVFLAHALLGKWYYGRLFDSPDVVKMGAEYWFWYGVGFFGCSFIFSFRFFFVAVSRNIVVAFTGVCELIGNVVSAFWLIPRYGNIGCSIAKPLGWWIAALYLVISYVIMRKKIYSGAGKVRLDSPKKGERGIDETDLK